MVINYRFGDKEESIEPMILAGLFPNMKIRQGDKNKPMITLKQHSEAKGDFEVEQPPEYFQAELV